MKSPAKSRRRSPDVSRRFASHEIGAALLLIALVLVAYSRVIGAGFIWDDPQYVISNYELRDLAGLFNIWFHPTSLPQWYPLVHTTFWIEYHLWGATSAGGYHVTNILLHVANALLVWRLLVQLKVPGAWLAAAVFAVHPVEVESVAWVTERKNVLSLLFYLLAIRKYLSIRERDPRRLDARELGPRGLDWRPLDCRPSEWRAYTLALLLFICALFSKTVTASMPAAILVILWWKRGRLKKRDILPLIPFFVIGGFLSWFTAHLEVTHVGADGSKIPELNLHALQRIFIAGRAVWFYAGKILVPWNLTFIYPRWNAIDRAAPWLWIFPLAAISVIAALAMLRKQIGRAPLAAVLLFCGTLVPALGFANVYPMRFSFVADHFQYHASVALIALFVAIVWRAVGRVQPHVVSAFILIPLVILTIRQATIYDDPITLWRATLQRNPDSWMVHTNLANALVAAGDQQAAEPEYLKALELAPHLHDTHANAGSVFGRRGDYARAVAEYQTALQIDPTFAPAYYGWGQVLERQGRTDEALEKLNKAIELAPHYPEANFRAGHILEQRGQLNDAIERYRVAVTYYPEYFDARYNLGTALLRLKQYDEAAYNLMRAVEIDPQNVEAWTNLGGAQLLSGHVLDASASFQTALNLRPGFPPAAAGLRQAQAMRR